MYLQIRPRITFLRPVFQWMSSWWSTASPKSLGNPRGHGGFWAKMIQKWWIILWRSMNISEYSMILVILVILVNILFLVIMKYPSDINNLIIAFNIKYPSDSEYSMNTSVRSKSSWFIEAKRIGPTTMNHPTFSHPQFMHSYNLNLFDIFLENLLQFINWI